MPGGPLVRTDGIILMRDGNVDQVCISTGQKNDRKYYSNGHARRAITNGQAPTLWCAVALLRAE